MPRDETFLAPAVRQVLPLVGRGLRVSGGGRTLLDGVDLDLDGDAVTVLLGPNGAGKSLLLRVLAGLVPSEAGTVTWAGRPPDRRRAAKLGFVFQKPVMLHRSVLENVRYALRAAGVARAARGPRAQAALAGAGLERLAGSPARVLSGGEQQRLAIARALATEPEVLLLDEPTSSLDPASTLAIETLVCDARDRGTKIVFVTHDIGQARRLADEVVFLHHGRLVERSPADRFFAGPKSHLAGDFIHGRIVL